MLAQVRQLAQTGLKNGFFRSLSPTLSESSPLIFHHGPLTSNLHFHFQHEWIKSFARFSCGRYNFLWLDSLDQYPATKNMTLGWSTKMAVQDPSPPLALHHQADPSKDDYLCVRYMDPLPEINISRLADERTRFWKKYCSRRERLECLSSKQNQFHINYRLAADLPVYQLETIQCNKDASFDLSLNINHALSTLLIDSQMKNLHPLLTAHQIVMQTNSKANELSLYLGKLFTSKYQLRVLRLNGEHSTDTVPFRLMLDENSVKNGVCTVWSRDTQLSEEMHVKQVAKRLADYFQALDDVV